MIENDIEQLSAYLDGVLSDSERAVLEVRLNTDPDLRAELDELRQTIALVKALPPMRAPRNFTLTREMVGDTAPHTSQRAPSRSRILFFPTSAVFSAVSAVAAMFLFVIGAGILLNRGIQSEPLASLTFNPGVSGDQVALAPSETRGRSELQTLTGAGPANAAEDVPQEPQQGFAAEENFLTTEQEQQAQDDSTLQDVVPAAPSDLDELDGAQRQALSQTATLDALGYTNQPTLFALGTPDPFAEGADSAFAMQAPQTMPFPTPIPTQVDGEFGMLEGEGASGSGGAGAGGGFAPPQAGIGSAQSSAIQPSPLQPETAASIAQADSAPQTSTATITATLSRTLTSTATDTATDAPSATPMPTSTPTPPPASSPSNGLGVLLVIAGVALLTIAALTTLARIRNR
jgi:anti-sigma factor RsiW